MIGQQAAAERLFYDFCLEDHVPTDHLLRGIDHVLDLSEVRQDLKPFYSQMGRPSVDPELMIRMLLIGYCFGIRSERRLCDEVHLNLGYRWFCRLGLESRVPDHSTFSLNRHGRFRESDTFRLVFESVVRRCMAAHLVGGEGFAIDASAMEADASRYRGVAGDEPIDWSDPRLNTRAVREYLDALDPEPDPVRKPPKTISLSDPSSAWTAKANKRVQFGYGLNYLIDNDNAIIVDVEATPARTYDKEHDIYVCPGGNLLNTTGKVHADNTLRYLALKHDCEACPLKQNCCPNTTSRKIPRDVNEEAREYARSLADTEPYEQSCRERKKVEMLFAHLKRHLGFERLRLRGLTGASDEFLLAATVQNLKRLAKLTATPPPSPQPT
ncbi:MAG: transposase [Hyphomicrobium sp.]